MRGERLHSYTISLFGLGRNVGGSSAALEQTRHIPAPLTYLVASMQEHPLDIFGQNSPSPLVLLNPVRSKPHLRISEISISKILGRSWDLHIDWRWIRSQDKLLRMLQPSVTISMTTLASRADLFIVHFLRAQSFLNDYGYPMDTLQKLMARLDLKERQLLKLEQRNLTKPNYHKILVPSEQMAEATQTFYGVSDEDIILLPNAIDVDLYPRPSDVERMSARRKLGIGQDCLVVAFAARSPERKGLQHLQAAIGRLRNAGENIVLLTAGYIPNSEMRDRSFDLGAEEINLGELEYPNIVDTLFAASDVIALPSSIEPYGGVILEAASSGLIPVISRFCGAAEVLPKDCGFVLPFANPVAELTEALKTILDHPHIAPEMSSNVARWIRSQPTWEDHSSRIFSEMETTSRSRGLLLST